MKLSLKNKLSELLSLKSIFAGAALALVPSAVAQDHGHLYISAYSKNAGAQLYFDNGGIFEDASGYVKTLLLNTNVASRFFGRYDANITFTPRSTNTLRGADYAATAAAPGSVIYFQITQVDGPPGGTFEFWESIGTQPAFTVPVGSGATNLVKITEASGDPNGDPYGHIHGRRFTASVAGIYRVTFRAWDLSTNGPGAGPIHTPSERLPIHFQAGFAIASVKRTNNVATVKFGTATTHDFILQSSTNLLSSSNWVNVGTQFRGNDYFQSVQDTTATNAARFYRVQATLFVP
jgi:hypothetical protein